MARSTSATKRKSSSKSGKLRKKTGGSPNNGNAKGMPWTFPKNTLEDAIRIPKAIEEKNAGNPMPAEDVAIAAGYRQASDWRFLDLLRSANLYDLVQGTGASASINLTPLGQDIVAPSSPSQRSNALLEAFRNVKDFAAVDDFYGGKKIPEDEFFLNTLTREFHISRDRVEAFAHTFTENLSFLRAFRGLTPVGSAHTVPVTAHASTMESEPTSITPVAREARVREFLDTCFVMMPFGEWFDRYYQEVYVPAIKDAGYEPVRADELFSTGSVMEQIWEQISKAKLLLADMSGRNPNVFYELGLAHAARKPVIFTAGTVDDVPFDLRHLRVIIYDVREPQWAQRLQEKVTDHLRNVAKSPEKSIPHPFRRTLENGTE